MEITTQLPISQWYFHDLSWWGLDYPPLTAYHSWMLGKIGALIDPSWFALYTSRGLHNDALKVFMRATVIISEYLIYIPASVIFVRRFSRLQGVQSWDASIALVAILLQPSTILIDHVHFQYNTVMLGLVLASTSSILAGRYMWSAVFFVLALGFKQMALYYAPAVFAYLLGVCVSPRINLPRLIGIASVTLATFILLILPLILGALYDYHRGIISPELHGHVSPLPVLTVFFEQLNNPYTLVPIQQLAQMAHRIFPFARGLFEDKVANFWCTLNIIYKLKHYPIPLLQKASLALTLASILPPCIIIFLQPKKELFPLALATTAWGFFLFSFQVHEKSVLLPLLPMTLLLAGRDGLKPATRAWVGWANNVAVWTLFPLLERVELRVPYAVLGLLWAYLLGLPPVDWSLYAGLWRAGKGGKAVSLLHGVFYVAMVAWHGVEAWVQAPETLPDLWVVANVGVGAVSFGIAYLWCLWTLLDGSGLLGEKNKTKKILVKKR
jgi:alpha-1,3-glucosyltransferase